MQIMVGYRKKYIVTELSLLACYIMCL